MKKQSQSSLDKQTTLSTTTNLFEYAIKVE